MNLMTIDTETTNTLDDPIVYDLGLAIHDENGNVFHTESLVIAETFLNEELMASAYFIDKIPNYWKEIKEKKRRIVKFETARRIVKNLIRRYGIKVVIAHNAYFDYHSLNTTLRYYTSSKYRYFLPWGVEIWDSLRMAKVLLKDENYVNWTKENNYLTEKRKTPKLTAEVIYRYITENEDFEESHTGLEDVMIEKEITKYLLARKDPNMKRMLFNKSKSEDTEDLIAWYLSSLME